MGEVPPLIGDLALQVEDCGHILIEVLEPLISVLGSQRDVLGSLEDSVGPLMDVQVDINT